MVVAGPSAPFPRGPSSPVRAKKDLFENIFKAPDGGPIEARHKLECGELVKARHEWIQAEHLKKRANRSLKNKHQGVYRCAAFKLGPEETRDEDDGHDERSKLASPRSATTSTSPRTPSGRDAPPPISPETNAAVDFDFVSPPPKSHTQYHRNDPTLFDVSSAPIAEIVENPMDVSDLQTDAAGEDLQLVRLAQQRLLAKKKALMQQRTAAKKRATSPRVQVSIVENASNLEKSQLQLAPTNSADEFALVRVNSQTVEGVCDQAKCMDYACVIQ